MLTEIDHSKHRQTALFSRTCQNLGRRYSARTVRLADLSKTWIRRIRHTTGEWNVHFRQHIKVFLFISGQIRLAECISHIQTSYGSFCPLYFEKLYLSTEKIDINLIKYLIIAHLTPTSLNKMRKFYGKSRTIELYLQALRDSSTLSLSDISLR